MNNKLLFKILIKGQVQGVGFRWRAATEARSRGITGYVENRSDRSVYIEAEGYRKQLDAFIEWCKEGPGIGYVESVTVDSCPPVNYSEFQIRH